MMELADVTDSKSVGSDTVSVRPRLPAPGWAWSETRSGPFFYIWREYPDPALKQVSILQRQHSGESPQINAHSHFECAFCFTPALLRWKVFGGNSA